MASLVRCKVCKKEHSDDVKRCPSCGAKYSKPISKRPLALIFAGLFGLMVFQCASVFNKSPSNNNSTPLAGGLPVMTSAAQTQQKVQAERPLLERFQAQRVGLIRDLNESLKTKNYYAIVGPAGEFEPIADPEYLALLKRVRAEEAKQIASELAASAARDKAKNRKEGISLGMSKEQVLSSNWGRPEHINTTTTVHGTREQWVYGKRAYLYFQDGVLTTIQN